MPLSHLSDHNEHTSNARVEVVRDGLAGPAVDRPLWLRVAQSRIDDLEGREMMFGLESFEKNELSALKQLLNIEATAG